MPLGSNATHNDLQKGTTVFVVEDHEVLRQLIVKLLNGLVHCRVVGEAASAEDALEDPDQAEADIVMTDLSLPGMSGLELVQRLCAHDPQRRIIVLSAYKDRFTARRAFQAGASAYLIKDNPELIERVVKAVQAGKRDIYGHDEL